MFAAGVLVSVTSKYSFQMLTRAAATPTGARAVGGFRLFALLAAYIRTLTCVQGPASDRPLPSPNAQSPGSSPTDAAG